MISHDYIQNELNELGSGWFFIHNYSYSRDLDISSYPMISTVFTLKLRVFTLKLRVFNLKLSVYPQTKSANPQTESVYPQAECLPSN